MKAYAVSTFVSSDRVSAFHTDLFHGTMPEDNRARDALPFAEHGVTAPLRVVRNAWHLPEITRPHTRLVVSPMVRRKLEVVPNLEFLPVEWAHVYSLPYRPGDFSWRPEGEYDLDDPDALLVRRQVQRLPHLPELAPALPEYSEVLVHRLKDVALDFSDAAPASYRPRYSLPGEAVPLSASLLRAYPVVWIGGEHIFSEPAFRLVEPHLDPDYFKVAELSVN